MGVDAIVKVVGPQRTHSADAVLVVDIETASAADIKSGAWAYSQHPSTIVLCVVFAICHGPNIRRRFDWLPGRPIAEQVARHIHLNRPVVAHNALFEWSIWTNILRPVYDAPAILPEQWLDTAARAAGYNLPVTLEGVGKALGCTVQKDLEGAKVMKRMMRAKPDGLGGWTYERDPEDLKRLVEYCWVDVAATADVFYRLPAPHPFEAATWVADQAINRRGVMLDQKFADQCRRLAARRGEVLKDEVCVAADGALDGATSVPALKAWVEAQNVVLPVVARRSTKGKATTSASIDRAAVAAILEGDVSPAVRTVLSARAEIGKLTSLAKLKRVGDMVGRDGRLRGAFRYCGAHTGRWASSGLQLHNLPKNKLDPGLIDMVTDCVASGDLDTLTLFMESPLAAMSQLLRSIIVAAPGHDLLAADYAGIEARVVAWLAGQHDILDVFRAYDADKRNVDVYVFAASRVGSTNRQLGKVLTLALGYGMGAVKFQTTAAGWGVPITLKEADDFKTKWREANASIVAFWREIGEAFRTATLHPGETTHAGVISFRSNKHFLKVTLPSGRPIFYHRPHVKWTTKTVKVVNEAGEIEELEIEGNELRFYTVGKDKRSMRVEATYDGKLCENIVQAVARDLLAGTLPRLERTIYKPVVHVHDSVASEVPEGTGSLEEFEALVAQQPAWAEGLPIAVDGYRGKRFRG